MNIAAIYSRKSRFTNKGESIENQIQMCREYALKYLETNSFIIYEDEGFSGANLDRPGFQKMLMDAQNKKFEYIICYRLDRISRNVADFSQLVTKLHELGIGFISIKEQFDTSTPIGRAMMNITAVFAQLERETIRERIQDNMLELAKYGRWLGGRTPFGYLSHEVIYLDGESNKKKYTELVSDYDALEYVKLLYSKYLQYKSLSALEAYCKASGIKGRNDHPLSKSSLKVILSNPVYVIPDKSFYLYCKEKHMSLVNEDYEFTKDRGIMAYNKNFVKKGEHNKQKDYREWIIALSNHSGVIDSSTWISVQNRLGHFEGQTRNIKRESCILSGMIRCGFCGSKIKVSGKYSNGKMDLHYYKCSMKEASKNKKCSVSNIHGPSADSTIMNFIKSIPVDYELAEGLLNAKIYEYKKTHNKDSLRISSLNKELKRIERSIDNLTDQLSRDCDNNTAQYIIAKIGKNHEAIETIRKQIQDINNDEVILTQFTDGFLAEFEKLNASLDLLEFERKRFLMDGIFKDIIWNGDSLMVSFMEAK